MKNQTIADLLDRMGTLLAIKGENDFKIRAYHTAAANIRALAEDIAKLHQEGRLGEIPGVGKAMQEKIAEYLTTGRMSAYEKLVEEIPESLLEIVDIPGIGPKKARLFYDRLGIKNRSDLLAALKGDRLKGLPGIQQKTIENIIKGIEVTQAGLERMNLGEADRIAAAVIEQLTRLVKVKTIVAAGSLRRFKETVRDIDLLVVPDRNPQTVMDAFVSLPCVKSVTAHGEKKSSVRTREDVQVDLRVVEKEEFGAALLYFTGSKGFNVRLRQKAQQMKLKVNEYGVFRLLRSGQEKRIAGSTEEECLKALGLPYVPPELREDYSCDRIFGGAPIPALLEQRHIQGDLHVHSTWSDGRNTIAEMAQAAAAKGYRYLAVCDHSPRLRVASGVAVEDLPKKKAEIDRWNRQHPELRVLFGTEVEIDLNGRLDYDDDILARFDVVIAAVHSGFEQSRERMTQRLIRACEHPCVNIIAHPTAVHLGKRRPCDIDLERLARAAAETGTALEINGFPVRLDLNGENADYTRRFSAVFAVNTDSHNVLHLDHMKYAVGTARRGWITPKEVINTWGLDKLLAFFERKRARAKRSSRV